MSVSAFAIKPAGDSLRIIDEIKTLKNLKKK